MPSTYTTNNGIELIATGEQSGTWGSTTNTNLELLDASLDGQVTVTLASTGTSGSPNTLPISDGSASNGRNRLVIFNDGTDLGGTAYVQLTPNDAEKIVYVRNSLSGSRSILLFQGTYNASNDYEVPAGTTAVVFFDGAGTGAVAANVFNNAHFDALNIVGNSSVGGTLGVTGAATLSSTLSVTGTSTFNDDVTFVGNTNNIVIDKSADSMTFQDASKLIFGTGSDLLIEHSGVSTESRIWNYGGNLSIAQQANDEDVDILSDDGSGGTASYFRADGSTGEAMLFHYGSEKLATKSTGIDVTGTVTDDGATHDGDVTFTGASYNVVWDKSDNALEFADSAKATFGTGADLELYHNGSNSLIGSYTGTFFIVQYADDGDIVLRSDNGSGGVADYFRGDGSTGEAILYHYGNQKLATKSTGIDVTGTAEVDGLSINGTALTATAAELNYNDITTLGQVQASKVVTADANGDVTFLDNDKVVFGTGSDYEIYNDGSTNEQLVFNEATSGIPNYVFQGNFAGSIGPTLRLKHTVTSGSSSSFPATFKMSTKNAGGTDIDAFSLTNLLVSATAGASTSIAIFGVQESGGSTASTAYLTLDGSNENITFNKDVYSSGNVGIGTSSPSYKLDVDVGAPSSTDQVLGRFSSQAGTRSIGYVWDDSASTLGIATLTNHEMAFHINGNSNEKMRIDSSGNLLVGRTSVGSTGDGHSIRGADSAVFSRASGESIIANSDTVGTVIQMRKSGSIVGSISVTSSSTAYNTSSDHRLKENVTDVTDGITRVKQLEPKRFNFIADPDRTVDGFLAHEAQAVVPEAVTGTHNEVDDEGNPVHQGIDQSKLVPLLTAALKEAITKIETLETEMTSVKARLDALEGV